MSSSSFPATSRLRRFVGVAGLLIFLDISCQVSVAQVTDPNLQVTITPINQSVVVSWFGSNALAYQLESGPSLTTWTNSGALLTGRGALLSVTNASVGLSRNFFRVKRLPPALIRAVFEPQSGMLTITGDEQDNVITVSRNAAGTLLVNGGAVAIQGGTATVANTVLIQAFGRAGNDQISLNEANGALPPAHLFGEADNDTLIGGSGADIINGGPGADILLGKGGPDTLIGGDGDDVLTGGDGDDIAQGGSGNDRLIWNPGDDTDTLEGGGDIDTVEVNGGNGAEVFTVTANGTRVRFDRVSPAPFFLDIGTCEKLVLNANGGNDTFSATGNLATLIQITVDGGSGDDILLGSNGPDVLIGGGDNDFVDGNQGNDIIRLGAGDDVFQWDPGDGNDTVEGEAGNDTLQFNGSNIGENIDISANGARLRFLRNVGAVALDLGGIETVTFNAVGGADNITVQDLAGTEVTAVNLNVAGAIGSSTGDGQADSIFINGTSGSESVTVANIAAGVRVTGPSATVTISNSEAANDRLIINLLGGDDIVDASTLAPGFIALTVDGGAGADVLIGSAGADTLLGGTDDDVLIGGPGADVLDGGPGNNVVIQE